MNRSKEKKLNSAYSKKLYFKMGNDDKKKSRLGTYDPSY